MSNWAQRRKVALERLGDNILESAERNAKLRQQKLREYLEAVIDQELEGIKNEELREAVIQRFLKTIPEKPLTIMVDVAIEKISKKISEPINPF